MSSEQEPTGWVFVLGLVASAIMIIGGVATLIMVRDALNGYPG